jgi:trehalose/maltose hydrolase-like predicted phosphorylase
MLDESSAWSEFREALDADLDDTQGGTTGRGIHLGAMAGTVDIVLRTFTGIRIEADALTFRPAPPGALRRAAFELRYRDQRIAVTIDQKGLKLAAQPSSVQPARVKVGRTSVLLGGGQTLDFPT